MLYLEEILKPYISVSALLAIIIMGLIIALIRKEESKEIQKS